MDEGYFTKVKSATVGEIDKKLKRGRGSEKQTPVLVMAQTEYIENPKNHKQHSSCKFFKMRVMPNLESKTINMLVKGSLNAETEVVADSFSSYKWLNQVISQHVSKVISAD